MANSICDPNDPASREQLREIASILAEGYLRLRRKRKLAVQKTSISGEKSSQHGAIIQLDSSGHRSDE